MTDQTVKGPQYKRVADMLRMKIVSGELVPGERLPAEPDLDSTFGVSRSTWREAIRTLQAEGLVRALRGVQGGIFVVEPTLDNISDYLETMLVIVARARLTADNLVEARLLLEVPAAGVAAIRRDEATLDELARLIESSRAEPERTENHQVFHRVLLGASGNPLLAAYISPIAMALRLNVGKEPADSLHNDRVCREHEAILEALRNSDAQAACSAMRSHLEYLGKHYDDMWGSATPRQE